MSVLEEMLDNPRSASRSPRSNFFRSAAALIIAFILLVILAVAVRYAADNWRAIVYGQTASSHVVNPEDGFPAVSNDPARFRGAIPLQAADQA